MRNQTRLSTLAFALLFATIIFSSAHAADFSVVTKNVSLGVIPDGIDDESFTISPDGARVAYAAKTGEKWRVYVDGKPGKEYGKIWQIVFSPDGKRCAYNTSKSEDGEAGGFRVILDGVEGQEFMDIDDDLVFSPDSRQLAYSAWGNDGNQMVVANGMKSQGYKSITFIGYSPDSKTLAYIAGDGTKSWVVVDGVEGKKYDEILFNDIAWTDDGKHMTYRGIANGKSRLIADGAEGPEYLYKEPSTADYNTGVGEYSPIFSPDGKRMAYTAWRSEDKAVVVTDGVEGKAYDSIEADSLTFSEKGKHFAYAATLGNGVRDLPVHEKKFLVTDGVEGPAFDYVSSPVFSPDEKRLAYCAERDNKQFVVVDGVEGQQCSNVGVPVFSPDSKRLAYATQNILPVTTAIECTMVVNGVKGRTYGDIGTPLFSPDGQRLVYSAERSRKFLIVDNGVESKEYDKILTEEDSDADCMQFSPDGKHFVWCAELAGEWRVVVDGVDCGICDGIICTPTFDSPTKFHFLAQNGNEIVRTEAEIKPTK